MKRLNRRKFISTAATSTIGGALSLSQAPKSFAGGSELENSPYIIIIHCDGGWDPTLVFDNKITSSYIETQPGCTAAVGVGEGSGSIPYVNHADRPAVKTFFDNYGKYAAIVNGLHCGSMSHNEARQNSSGIVYPESKRYVDWLSYYGVQQGTDKKIPHIVIDAPQIPGIYGEFSARLTTENINEYRGAVLPSGDAIAPASETALATFLNGKYGKLLENRLNEEIDSEKLQTLQGGYIHEPSLKEAINKVTPSGTKSDFANNLNLATSLLEGGYAKCITIQAGKDKLWDTHTNNDATQSTNYEMLFSAINEMINATQVDSSTSVLKGQLTVIVKSEMGRSPKLNSSLQKGKGHWPFSSALLWGVGINGGKVFGATDDRLRGMPINPIFGTTDDPGAIPLEMTSIIAALYNLFGIPYTLLMPDVTPASMLLSLGA